MLDRERLLARVDHLQRYLRELREIVPPTYEQYTGIEKRRACERLLQLAIEAVTDTCALLVTGLRLGLPAETGDLFDKLGEANVVSPSMVETLKRMRGFRNILVHEYIQVDDRIVYDAASRGLERVRGLRRWGAGLH